MRNLIFLLLVLVVTPSFSQKRFTIQELIDLYTSKSKEEAITKIESKGYVKLIDVSESLLFRKEDQWTKNGEQILFEFYVPDKITERFGYGFIKGKADLVCYQGPIEGIEGYKQQLLDLNFPIAKERGSRTQIFQKKKDNYFVWYELTEEDQCMLSILPKKELKYLYSD